MIDRVFANKMGADSMSVEKIKERKKIELDKLEKKLEQIEQTIVITSTVALQEKLEKDWSQVNSEINLIESQLSSDSKSVNSPEVLLSKTKSLFENPIAVRKLGSPTMRKLLLIIRF